ncbi:MULTISPECIES: hypothetical protein [unclassified Mycobacterium]|uniref:hypothetical protein n=1 Tax=unclassified Mycobacterium TaxID=2642494 RepID=UPI0007FFB546|nr:MULTISPECIES: hypothetical protein [unclassified Mycobacterium]OBG71239.1 hypothetical protein A5700_12300 [Mycobacterium sp. E1214]OBH22081.1 hypothetical protein A5693_14695 [Mycobacterium sp. E1319]
MPIYALTARNQRANIPAGPLSITISGAVHDAALDIQAAPAQPVVRSSPQHVVVPSLAGPLTIAVRPAFSTQFGPGTVVHLAIAHDIPGEADPVQVLFDPVDVSGDTTVVFAELRPVGPYIEVVVTATADTALSPLAAAARTSARRLIGRDRRRANADLVVALNSSASMRPWFADGSAAAATDVVTGVADALGFRDVAAVLVGADITKVSAAATGLADAVRQARPRWSAGARWSRLREDVATVACSDFPTSGIHQGFALLALSDDRRVSGPRLPAPRPGQDATAELLAHAPVLDEVAAGLVRALT